MSSHANTADKWIASATVVSTLVAVVALVFLITQVNYARTEFTSHKTEQKSEKTEQLWREWVSPTMLLSRAKTAGNYPTMKGSPYQTDILTFFERAARFQQNGIVTADDLDYYFQDYILAYWCVLQPWVAQSRKERGDSTLWDGFEGIATNLQPIQHGACMPASEMRRFMQFEQERYTASKVVTGS